MSYISFFKFDLKLQQKLCGKVYAITAHRQVDKGGGGGGRDFTTPTYQILPCINNGKNNIKPTKNVSLNF
jgi:hypothetical protein